jgi:hypothetical protein
MTADGKEGIKNGQKMEFNADPKTGVITSESSTTNALIAGHGIGPARRPHPVLRKGRDRWPVASLVGRRAPTQNNADGSQKIQLSKIKLSLPLFTFVQSCGAFLRRKFATGQTRDPVCEKICAGEVEDGCTPSPLL